MSNKIIKNYPHYERKVLEFQKIAEAEDFYLDNIEMNRQKVLLNQFVLTADENGLSMFENLYNIVPLATDTIEDRRKRILIRIQLQPPYTLKFLMNQLDKIIGPGKYELDINYDKYQIIISSAAESQLYAQEISIIMGKIKPCNMQYISSPLVITKMNIGDAEFNIPIIRNYRLGTTWNLGQKPFVSLGRFAAGMLGQKLEHFVKLELFQ